MRKCRTPSLNIIKVMISLTFVVLFTASCTLNSPGMNVQISGSLSEVAYPSDIRLIETEDGLLVGENSHALQPSYMVQHHHLLEDFDFLIATMEENFPFFGLHYRRNGTDILELAAEIRHQLVSTEDLDSQEFFQIMARFLYEKGLAHLNLLTFYRAKDFSSNIADPNLDTQNLIFEPFVFDPPPQNGTDSITRDLIETKIIEYGKIAYINFPNISGYWEDQVTMERKTLEFITSLENYEHLIVDIRETRGGWNQSFVNSIIRPNISKPFEDFHFAFHTPGKHTTFVAEQHRGQIRWHRDFQSLDYYPRRMTTEEFLLAAAMRFAETSNTSNDFMDSLRDSSSVGLGLSATEIADRYNLIHINQEDLANLAYGYRLQTRITPNHNAPSFDGQIWLLTSSNNFSASEAAARLAKDTGVAILVGQTTGGAIGGGATSHIRLPNTSLVLRWDTIYITDRYGRALEEYRTTPHFENRPGLDALATVLELIEEGVYLGW